PDGYGWGTANDQTADARTVSAQLLDRPQRAPPLQEVMRNPQFGLVGQRVSRLHQDEAVTLGQWDCRRKDVSPDLVPASADADGHGERDAGRGRQARILQQHPEPEFEVLSHGQRHRSVSVAPAGSSFAPPESS